MEAIIVSVTMCMGVMVALDRMPLSGVLIGMIGGVIAGFMLGIKN
jgi:hypothetical protein